LILHNPGDIVVIFMVFIKRQFIPDPKSDDHGYGHADGKSYDINRGVCFVLNQVPPRYFEIILYHNFCILSLNNMLFADFAFHSDLRLFTGFAAAARIV